MTAADIIEKRREAKAEAYAVEAAAPQLPKISFPATSNRLCSAEVTSTGELTLVMSDCNGRCLHFSFDADSAGQLGEFISKYWPHQTKAAK